VLTIRVDPARSGWVAVALADGRLMDTAFEGPFPALLERFPEAEMLASTSQSGRGQERSSSETLSTWGVCGNKSIGLVRRSV
jgi:hypothetical protein